MEEKIIFIPKDKCYIEILGHRIDEYSGFEEFVDDLRRLKNVEKNSIPISVIEKKIKTLEGALDYVDIAEYSISTITDKIDVLQELLDERNNKDD